MDNPSKIKTQTKASSFTLIVAFICVALIGLALIPLLPVKLNPSRTLPGFTVQFSMPGTSSRVVEIEATSKLEAMLARIKGIKNIYSTSDNGSGSITIELDKYADIDAVRFEASTIIRQTSRWSELSLYQDEAPGRECFPPFYVVYTQRSFYSYLDSAICR